MISNRRARSWPADPTAIELTYTHQQPVTVDTGLADTWQISADIDLSSDTIRVHVGDIEIVELDPDHVGDPSTEPRHFGRLAPAVDLALDDDGAGLHPVLQAHLSTTSGRILILTRAELTPDWRGFGLGVLLTGFVLKHLSRDARAANTRPTRFRFSSTGRRIPPCQYREFLATNGIYPFVSNLTPLRRIHQACIKKKRPTHPPDKRRGVIT